MRDFWISFVRTTFPLHPIFFCLAFQLPLAKRSRWPLRCGLSLALALFSVPAMTVIFQATGSSLQYSRGMYYLGIFAFLLFQLAALVLLFWFDCDVSFSDALYGTICAYATQHMSDALTMLLFPDQAFTRLQTGQLMHLPSFVISLAVLIAGYFLVAVQLPEKGRYRVSVTHTLLSAALVVGFALLLSYSAKIMQTPSSLHLFRICMMFDLLCCVFVLWVQVERQREKRLIREVQTERVIRAQQKDQFDMVQAGIERVNRKCHDLKHQIAAIRRISDSAEQQKCLAELEQTVLFYDYMVKSGNAVIDTVLTEKSLVCEQEGITWTCMANGPTLDFMEDGDLYLLFNGALENAIESVRKLSDPKRRIIALTLHRKRDMAFLQIENYFDQPPVFVNGLPRSTKPGGSVHGYGLRAIRSVVEKYHGTLDLSAENGLFLFSVLIPLPCAPAGEAPSAGDPPPRR